ncbi:MAG: efflux RND transporter periplasmic adaptor subunit [Lachnospiraceae bacterium]|nr:efflux RND transporter periplasmic adaptor subunit [Lachnospiraceae bacterium]
MITIVFCLAVSGCGESPQENVVVINNESDNTAYGLTSVTKEDVVLTKLITATYMQVKEQTVSFDSGGRRIAKVYVNPGDSVKKGDLLVELDQGNLQEQIDELEYRIQKNELLLKDLDTNQKFDKESAYNSFVYGNPNISEDDLKEYQKNQDSIDQNYEYKREDYNDELEFDRLKLNKLKNELKNGSIYSNMDGVVYKVTEDLEGSTSKKDEVVMTIVDNETGRFETTEPDYAGYFHEGEAVELKVVYSQALGDYEVVPYDMASWGETQIFEVISGPDNEGIDVGTTGSIKVVLDEKKNVLSLPIGAIYYADEKPYVYVLDENGFKQMMWVEIGLIGDERVEITSGLNEGDQVVYR